jgi:putative phosphoesterase
MNVGLILHAGDAGHTSVLQSLEQVAPTIAVRGNADPVDLIERLPDRVWIEAGSRTVLLMHGHHGKTALKAARAAAAPNVDLIVFGHSHRPLIEREGSTILFNPGSPTERRWNPHFGVGLIRVSDAELEPELVLFDDPRHLANVDP